MSPTRLDPEQTASLEEVRRQAAKVASAREELAAAIRAARAADVPLRTIAKAAGMTHETVRRIAAVTFLSQPPRPT
ncbi:MAG: hypothetical protein ACXVZW_06750 [Gaiellaceae bacterium]